MAENNGRDSGGRFTLGNCGGPGRPRLATEQQYCATIVSTCTIQDWEQIVSRAVTDAKAGCHRARDWLSRYLVPDPSTLPIQADVDSQLKQRLRLLGPEKLLELRLKAEDLLAEVEE